MTFHKVRRENAGKVLLKIEVKFVYIGKYRPQNE